MRIRLVCFVALLSVFALVASTASSQEKKKKEAPKRLAFISEKDAGPDFAFQGEYSGELGGMKVGAHVIARGDGVFDINLLPGGLAGAGWDGKEKMTGTAKIEGERLQVAGKDFSGDVESGTFTVRAGDKTGVLKHVVRKSPTVGLKPPPGAVILFDGSDETVQEWANGKLVEDGLLNNGVTSKKKFKDFTLHLEFRLPFMPKARGQGRANSGLYLQNRYELQILDSFGLKGVNNECGGFYQLADPDVNMCLPPLTWQTYDIDFAAARFEDGKRTRPATVTVKHNGVAIHSERELKKESPGGQKEDDTPGAFQLQNHGDPVHFRNIWVLQKH